MASTECRAITFDGDGTLWDFEAAMVAALDDAAASLRAAGCGPVSGRWSRKLRDEVADLPRYRLARMEDIRHAAFAEAVRRLEGPAALVDEVYELYMDARFARIEPYPEVPGVLERLRADGYRLALVTNGNTYPHRVGMGRAFDAIVIAGDVGVRKPDSEIFAHATSRLRVDPGECLHVGDDCLTDVRAAQTAGLGTVWLNREGAAWPLDGCADVPVIGSLAQLPVLL